MSRSTHMRQEVLEIPLVIERLLGDGRAAILSAAESVRALNPDLVKTVARSWSDHAANYLKYAYELLLGVSVASAGPSAASVYGADLRLKNAACIGISQSGQSLDIVQLARSATEKGAVSVTITSNAISRLAQASQHVIPILTGSELSVATTKTFVTSMVVGLALLAHWKENEALTQAKDDLPSLLRQATSIDWPELRTEITEEKGMYVLGLPLAVSNEAALKFKETCQIHSVPRPRREILRGPVSIVSGGFPVLALVSRDASELVITGVCDQRAGQGTCVYTSSDKIERAKRLDFVPTRHPLTDSITQIVSFYTFVEKPARDRGGNPDQPRHLKKVTETK